MCLGEKKGKCGADVMQEAPIRMGGWVELGAKVAKLEVRVRVEERATFSQSSPEAGSLSILRCHFF